MGVNKFQLFNRTSYIIGYNTGHIKSLNTSLYFGRGGP